MAWAAICEKIKLAFTWKTKKVVNKGEKIGPQHNYQFENMYLNSITNVQSSDAEYIIRSSFCGYQDDNFKFNKEKFKELLDWANNFNTKLKNREIFIEKLTNEKQLKIFNFLSIILLDEEKDEKENSYLYDIQQLLDDKTYTTISDKLSFEEIQLVLRIASNHVRLNDESKLIYNFYKKNGWYYYIDFKTLFVFNNKSTEYNTIESIELIYTDFTIKTTDFIDMRINLFNFMLSRQMGHSYNVIINRLVGLGLFNIAYIPIPMKYKKEHNTNAIFISLLDNERIFIQPTKKLLLFLKSTLTQ